MTHMGLVWHDHPTNRLIDGLLCANMTVVLLFWMTMNVSATVMV